MNAQQLEISISISLPCDWLSQILLLEMYQQRKLDEKGDTDRVKDVFYN